MSYFVSSLSDCSKIEIGRDWLMSLRGADVTRATFLAFGSLSVLVAESQVWIDTMDHERIWYDMIHLESWTSKRQTTIPLWCFVTAQVSYEHLVKGTRRWWQQHAGNPDSKQGCWKCLETHEMAGIFRLRHMKVETRWTLHVCCPLQAAISFHCLLHLPWHQQRNKMKLDKSHVEVSWSFVFKSLCRESKPFTTARSPGDAHLSAWQRAFVARNRVANQFCLENVLKYPPGSEDDCTLLPVVRL